jgi:Pentapeptide repeats (8 copies)
MSSPGTGVRHWSVRADPNIKGTTSENLKGANLSGCYLVGANLSGASASNANLAKADLAGANFSGARPHPSKPRRGNHNRSELHRRQVVTDNLPGRNRQQQRRRQLPRAPVAELSRRGAHSTECSPTGSNLRRFGGTAGLRSKREASPSQNPALLLSPASRRSVAAGTTAGRREARA